MIDNPEKIDAITRFLPVFSRGDFAGSGSQSKENGVTSDEDVSAFVQACYDHGWVLPDFDWPAFAQTQEAKVLCDDPSTLAQATTVQLAKLLTVVIRQSRFADRAPTEAIDVGLVRGILQRLDALAASGTQVGKNRNTAQIREVINRNTFVSLALAEGFNAYLPVYDGGVDFILYREADGLLRKVQLKGRWTIDRKYIGRDLWVAFPIATSNGQEWYLILHDEMVKSAEADGKTKTESWTTAGLYSTGKPSKAMIAAFAPHRFRSIAAVAAEAARGDDSVS